MHFNFAPPFFVQGCKFWVQPIQPKVYTPQLVGNHLIITVGIIPPTPNMWAVIPKFGVAVKLDGCTNLVVVAIFKRFSYLCFVRVPVNYGGVVIDNFGFHGDKILLF